MLEKCHKMDPVLYVLMRTDLDSLNSGKMAAQACHAANQFQTHATTTGNKRIKKLFTEWKKQGDGFGTTIVLDGGTEFNIIKILENFDTFGSPILDETYPLNDGQTTHLIPLITCGWCFVDRADQRDWEIMLELSKLGLHP